MLIHTGQHYDFEMSQVFFQDLKMPQPDHHLGVGSAGTHAEQTGRVMIGYEKAILEHRPDVVVVAGDVNSTLAAAVAAAKLHVPVAHVEAGLRSYDKTMPEEINRLLTDAISDYLFTHSPDASDNLQTEGVHPEKIFFVGNVVVDSLLQVMDRAQKSDILTRLGIAKRDYALLTLHRPANIDNKESLVRIIHALVAISQRMTIVFPAHPRTQKNLKDFGLLTQSPVTPPQLLVTNPLGYLDFLNLEMNARLVLTDSGGVQAETTILDVPCLTLLDSPVWPITHDQGTNILLGSDCPKLPPQAIAILEGKVKKGAIPKLWDGKTGRRIVQQLEKEFTSG